MSISNRTILRSLNLTFRVVGVAEGTNQLRQLSTTLNLIIRSVITATICWHAYTAAVEAATWAQAANPIGLALVSLGMLGMSIYDLMRTS